MQRRTALTLLAFLLVVGSTAGAAAAPSADRLAPSGNDATATEPYDIEVESTVVPTRHGDVYAEIARPVEDGEPVVSPVVLTYSPYGVLGRDANRDRWVPDGYAVVFADLIGTGNSGGCFDYGGTREKESGYDLVEWLGEQAWSNGDIAMTGGAYEAGTANAVATTQAPGLRTIIPLSGVSRMYAYTFGGGLRWTTGAEEPTTETAAAPLLLNSGYALVPPLDVGSADWADRVQARLTPCDQLEQTQQAYDETPDYDAFWQERDYLSDAANVDMPTLVASNWGDWTVKSSEPVQWFEALVASDADKLEPPQRMLWMGSRWDRHNVPTGGFTTLVDEWLDHHLKGVDNGVDDLPRYITHSADSEGALGVDRWDEPEVSPVTLYAQESPPLEPGDYSWKLLPTPPDTSVAPTTTVAEFPATGINTETHMNHHARFNHDWFWFESPPLSRDVRILGSPKIQLRLQTDRTWVTLTPTLVDVDMDCHIMAAGQHVGSDPRCHPDNLYSVTRGFLDTRYRDGLEEQSPLTADEPFDIEVGTEPTDYVFREGHRMGLQVSAELLEWAVPKVYPCDSLECVFLRVMWEGGDVRVVYPVVDAPEDPMMLFEEGGH